MTTIYYDKRLLAYVGKILWPKKHIFKLGIVPAFLGQFVMILLQSLNAATLTMVFSNTKKTITIQYDKKDFIIIAIKLFYRSSSLKLTIIEYSVQVYK